MRIGRRGRIRSRVVAVALALVGLGSSGCASFRENCLDRCLRPCRDEFAETRDGWHLGIRRFRPERPDPGKEPVVLCHGLGLNGTFWTITDDHLPGQLADRGYEVFVVDMRGSGASHRDTPIGRLNQRLRQTPLPEIGNGRWTMDDQVRYDVPAILDHVCTVTGAQHVNWVGHSLGGMLMFAYLETSPDRDRISNFVGMGSTAILAHAPQHKMLRASFFLRQLMRLVSTGRMARPMRFGRPPGLAVIDSLYYTAANVDDRTIDRFYGYTLEDPGPGALKQLVPFLKRGRMLSADGRLDYARLLGRITTPTLLVAGEGDIMSDMPSMELCYRAMASPDKELMKFGKKEGHFHDYGHCDLVWSRHAPVEVFPELIRWLDKRQPGVRPSPQASPQGPRPSPQALRAAPRKSLPRPQEGVDADLRPGLEPVAQRPELGLR